MRGMSGSGVAGSLQLGLFAGQGIEARDKARVEGKGRGQGLRACTGGQEGDHAGIACTRCQGCGRGRWQRIDGALWCWYSSAMVYTGER